MNKLIFYLTFLLPLPGSAQITGLGKLSIGQPLTVAGAYHTVVDDITAMRKVRFDPAHPADSTYAEVTGYYKDIGMEVNLTIFRNRLQCIRVSYSSLDVNSASDRAEVVKHKDLIDALYKRYGPGKDQATINKGDKDNVMRRWQTGKVAATLITRKQSHMQGNKTIEMWGMNLAILDESIIAEMNQFFSSQ